MYNTFVFSIVSSINIKKYTVKIVNKMYSPAPSLEVW